MVVIINKTRLAASMVLFKSLIKKNRVYEIRGTMISGKYAKKQFFLTIAFVL